MTFSFPRSPANAPSKRGQPAAPKQTFGPYLRYAVAPVHTRFDAVEWFVWDADVQHEDGSPDVIRQAATIEEALGDLRDAYVEHVTTFQIGQTYTDRAAGDYDLIYRWKVIARTAKTLTLRNMNSAAGEPFKRGVRTYESVERCSPNGRYSMAPVISADRRGEG